MPCYFASYKNLSGVAFLKIFIIQKLQDSALNGTSIDANLEFIQLPCWYCWQPGTQYEGRAVSSGM